jgi:tetratricopeptide (TPR) repeat protein
MAAVTKLVAEANALMEREVFARAIPLYRRVLAQEADHVEASFNLAGALAQTGELASAAAVFRALMAAQPDPAEAHANLAAVLEAYRIERYEAGMALMAPDRLEAALRAYREAIEALPVLHGCNAALGEIFMAQGQLMEADGALAEAAWLDADLPAAFLDLGATLRHPGDLAAALAHHRQVMAAAPDHGHITEQQYLETDLDFTEDELLMPDGFEVMMEWERPIMERSAEIVTHNHGDVLNVGFGMAIIDTAIQKQGVKNHTIIEAHPQVVARAGEWARDKTGVTIVPSTWQKALDQLPCFDGIYFDTLMPPMIPFLQHTPKILRPGGVFLYFQMMIQFENLEAMTGSGLEFGYEAMPFDEIPENRYYRLNERDADGRYSAPLFLYRKPL